MPTSHERRLSRARYPVTTPQPTPEQPARARVHALNDLAREQWRSDSERALALCDEAYALAEQLDYPLGLAYSLNVRSRCRLRLADPVAALEDVSAALALFRALEDEVGIGAALTTFGIIELDRGHFEEALRHFLAAHNLCEGRADTREAIALGNLGAIYDLLGDYAAALDCHLRSWSVSRRHGDGGVGEKFSQNNVGYMHYRLGQYEEALSHYFAALKLEGVGDQQLHALLLDNVALAYEKLGDHERALSYQQQSLGVREATGDQRGVGTSLAGLGSVYLAKGEYAEARPRLERSLALKEAVGDEKGQAETCILLGRLFTREGRPEQALPYLHRAWETAEALGSREDLYRAHGELAEAYKRGGCFREALAHHEHYHRLRNDLLNEASAQKLHTLRARFEVEQAERERELYRAKNAELAAVNRELELLAASLRQADAERSALLARLEHQAHEDPLTGLYNRRYFDARLAEELGRARRFATPLSVVFCDIDDFKRVNDRFSHQLGDKVLVTVAILLGRHLRNVDTVARYGGEEFMLLLPGTAAQGAAVSCEKIRRAIEVHPWETLAPGLAVTVSMGLSDDATSDSAHLLEKAGDKLYKAKHGGKNRVER